jgi:hypothetical protein
MGTEKEQVKATEAPVGVDALVMPYFGQFCSVTGKFIRRSESRRRIRMGGMDTWKIWKRVPVEIDNCLFIGVRTLKNGIIHHDDEGIFFDSMEYFRAALVCPGPNRAPIFVPLDAVRA